MPDTAKPDAVPVTAVRRERTDPLPVDPEQAEAAADPIHPNETTEAERHDPDPTEHAIQPAGQATSPASDAQAKDHQRTGDPDADAEELADTTSSEETVSVSMKLPKSVVAEIDRAKEQHNLSNRGDALALIFDRGAAPGGLVPSVGSLPADSPGSVDVIASSATPIDGTEDDNGENPKYSTVNLPRHLQNY